LLGWTLASSLFLDFGFAGLTDYSVAVFAVSLVQGNKATRDAFYQVLNHGEGFLVFKFILVVRLEDQLFLSHDFRAEFVLIQSGNDLPDCLHKLFKVKGWVTFHLIKILVIKVII
jgi:hypothetical protein